MSQTDKKCQEIPLPGPGPCKADIEIEKNGKKRIAIIAGTREGRSAKFMAEVAELEKTHAVFFRDEIADITVHTEDQKPDKIRTILLRIKQVSIRDLEKPKSKYHK